MADGMFSGRNGWLLVLCAVQIATVVIFALGFFWRGVHSAPRRDAARQVQHLQGCSENLAKKTAKDYAGSKMVIVLIDAWQEKFFYSKKNMRFLRQLTMDGGAVAFTAHVQTPTVTMPRIKALTAGVVPSFVDTVMNFASTSISNDNIIDQLKGNGYRLTFCGDETWLRLFPGRFDNSSTGTSSFYVNDYKEVDDNVTRCMTEKLEHGAIESWDLMILHYLGLDHIGHSLGGMHSEINNKLVEMDFIIAELCRKLSKVYGTNFSVAVFGDHGMTEGGSHGGSSKLETLVPVVFVDGKNRSAVKEVLPVAVVEQVDIVPTLASLFNVPVPNESLGVTLMPHIAVDRMDPSVVLLSVFRNSQQFQNLDVSSDKLDVCVRRLHESLEKYCEHNFPTDFGELIRECLKILHEVQAQLIRIETSIDNGHVVAAIAVSFIVTCICISLTCLPGLYQIGDFSNGYISTKLLYIVQLFHSVALFSSSLIEEEHDLQYFFFTSCLSVMLLEELHFWVNIKKLKNVRIPLSERRTSDRIGFILLLLVIHRLGRGYVESSRRRWIMEKDFIRSSNASHLLDFYEILTSTGSQSQPDLSTLLRGSPLLKFIFGVLSLFVVGAVLISLCGTTKHPRYLRLLLSSALFGIYLRHYGSHENIAFYLMLLSNISLILLHRDVLLSLTIWVIFIMRTYNLPLVALQLFMGYCMGRIDAQPLLLILAAYSSFFYMGNSNSLSTIDISVGFVGMKTYQPFPVSVQILLNGYSGTLLVFYIWWRALVRKSTNFNLLMRKRNIVLSSACSVVQLSVSTCLLSLLIQRFHLFIWSVFAPKFLYDLAHLLLLTLVVFSVYFYDSYCHLVH